MPVYLYSKQKLGCFFGPFGPFGPFLHIVCDAIRGILRQMFNVIVDQTDQTDQMDRKKIENVPNFCLLLSRRGIRLPWHEGVLPGGRLLQPRVEDPLFDLVVG